MSDTPPTPIELLARVFGSSLEFEVGEAITHHPVPEWARPKVVATIHQPVVVEYLDAAPVAEPSPGDVE